MRIQLTAGHTFNVAGAGAVMLKEASIVGDGAGDYPLSQIVGFVATQYMAGVDAAGTTAVSGVGGPRYMRVPPQSDGSLLPPSWSGPRPIYQGGVGSNWAAA